MYTVPLSALLVCSHSHSLAVLTGSLSKLKIRVHVCESNPVEALEHRKVDLLVVDFDEPNNAWFRDFAQIETYSNGIVVAASQSRETLRNKEDKYVQLTLLKPLTAPVTTKIIEDACMFLERERRSAWRHSANFTVSAELIEANKVRTLRRVLLRNISCAGAHLQTAQILPVSIQFDIPDTGRPFQATASVVWSESDGQCGVQFQHVCLEQISALREWLEMKQRDTNPLPGLRQVLPIASDEATWEI